MRETSQKIRMVYIRSQKRKKKDMVDISFHSAKTNDKVIRIREFIGMVESSLLSLPVWEEYRSFDTP